MLVEINLLPQKERKNKSLLWFALISFIILLLGGFFIFILNQIYESKMESIEKQISSTEKLVAIQQQKISSYQSSNSFAELEKTVKWAKQYPIKTIPVLKKVTELLPERGFIQTFNYEETGTVKLTVQFESTREAAYFLNTLNKSDWIAEAKLNSVNADTGFFDRQIGETERDESQLANEKYVPRYIADFDVTLNKDVIKNELASQTSEAKEGVDS